MRVSCNNLDNPCAFVHSCCTQDPWQLRQISGDLEEGNLILIQTSQVTAYRYLMVSILRHAMVMSLPEPWTSGIQAMPGGPDFWPRCHRRGSGCGRMRRPETTRLDAGG